MHLAFAQNQFEIQKIPTEIAQIEWLPRMDSNHDKVIQNHLCYRYTTRQLLAIQPLRSESMPDPFGNSNPDHLKSGS